MPMPNRSHDASPDPGGLPSRRKLLAVFATGLLCAIIGGALLLHWIWYQIVASAGIYDLSDSWQPVNVIVGLAVFIIGTAAAVRSWQRYDWCYREVLSGTIVNLYPMQYDLVSVSYDVWVEGLTRAGQRRTYCQRVSRAKFRGLKKGQYVNFAS